VCPQRASRLGSQQIAAVPFDPVLWVPLILTRMYEVDVDPVDYLSKTQELVSSSGMMLNSLLEMLKG
jgi:hypothetical protein